MEEEHLKGEPLDDLTIEKVEQNSPLAEELLHFAETCTWEEVKDHLAESIRNWTFSDWEAMFAAVVDGKIVGITSLCKTDYYPLPDLYPWVSNVYVDEAWRGHRISEKLISRANEYAVELGYTRSYLPTPHVGLYERYGYRYLGEITNYGGGVDHLYGKDLV